MFNIEHEFSKWLINLQKEDVQAVLVSDDLTIAAMNLIHTESMSSIDSSIKRGIPVSIVLDQTFLGGVTAGFLFREWLAQQEIHQL